MTPTTPLAAGFDVPAREAWAAEIEKLLKGRSADTLTRTTLDGATIPALHVAADAPEVPSAGLGRVGRWTIATRHAHPDGATANAQVLEDLAGGAEAIALTLASMPRLRGRGPLDGVAVVVLDDLDRALDGVWLDAAEIWLAADRAWFEAAAFLRALWVRREVAPQQRRGRLGADPIGAHARHDGDPRPVVDRALPRLGALAAAVHAESPQVRTVLVDGAPYHEAGGSVSQTIGAMLATGARYLDCLLEAGLSPDAAARQITLSLPLGPDQFLGIAGLRALRACWVRLLEVAEVPDAASTVEVRAVSGERSWTATDPWVNLLRGTVVAFAGAVGGADAVLVEPFDRALGAPGALGRRMARNTQLVLAEEARVAAVADPAGGSWFVEDLTEQLADAAWDELQQLLEEGGVVASLAAGLLGGRLHATSEQRRAQIDTRRRPITGVTEFPLLDEELPATAPASSAGLRERIGIALAEAPDVGVAADATAEDAVAAALVAAGGGASLVGMRSSFWPDEDSDATPTVGGVEGTFQGLPIVRDASGFESLRDRVVVSGAPQVFLANLGPLAEHNARTTFATNAYAVGGFPVVDVGSHDGPDEAVAAFVASGARAACICSSDARYAEQAEATARGLKDAGAEIVHLAGRLGEAEASLRAAGVDAAVGLGVDLFALLSDLARSLDADASVLAFATDEDPDTAYELEGNR